MDNATSDDGAEIKTNDERRRKADAAVQKALYQLVASTEFKKPRMERIARYWKLYDGKTDKKLRQLFNVAIPVFPGMIDTLNTQYDSPIQLKFKEGDASDTFKVQKINGAFQMEIMDTSQNSKWDSKLRMLRHHAIITGRGIARYTVTSDPSYKSELDVVNLKNFHFQPRGGQYLENHLFAGEENIEYTEADLKTGVKAGIYDKEQVDLLISRSGQTDYLPDSENTTFSDKLSRFKPLGLDPDNHNYIGEAVYKLCEWVLRIDGVRYYLLFHPWSKTWLRFEKWKNIDSSNLFPWKSFATHPDDENFLSKAFADDMYPAADAIVALFNQELTSREKRNFSPRAYDKDMFPDVRKLDEASFRPDTLVPADTKNGTRRISEGIYEFKSGELNGTVNLIDWMSGSIGRSTGATDLSQGDTSEASKKASVTFAEQKAVSKRIGWGSQPFQEMLGDLGKAFIYGLKDHMPSKMAIRVLGEAGWDWDQITRLDLTTSKDIDILIISSDKEMQESELKIKNRKDALAQIGLDPILAGVINPQKRAEELLRSVGQYDENEVAEFLDVKTYDNKKSLAKAAESIQLVLQGSKPVLWYGADSAFLQKIVNFASDNRVTLKEKYNILMDYVMAHKDIAMQNAARQAKDDARTINQSPAPAAPGGDAAAPAPVPGPANPGLPGGISKAMSAGGI